MSFTDDLALLRSLPRAYDPDFPAMNIAGDRLRILGFAYLDPGGNAPVRWCRTALGSTTLAWMDDTEPNLNAVRGCPCCKKVHRVEEVGAPAPAGWRAADIAQQVREAEALTESLRTLRRMMLRILHAGNLVGIDTGEVRAEIDEAEKLIKIRGPL